MKARDLTWREKAKLYWEQNKPFSQDEAAKRFSELPTHGPMDLLRKGCPSFNKMKVLTVLGVIWELIVYWATTTSDVYFEQQFLSDLSLSGTLVGLGLLSSFVWWSRDLQKGAFSDFDKQIEPLVWRDLLTKATMPGALRVRKAIQIWPPTARTKALIKSLNKEIEAAKVRAKADEVEEVTKDEDGTETEEPHKFSSLFKMRQIIRRHRAIDPESQRQEEAFSAKQEFVKLLEKYVILFETINFKYYVNVLECADDFYPLVISEHPLFESADTRGMWTDELLEAAEEDDEMDQPGFVEIRRHSFKQRTYIYQAENNNASWAVFTVLDWYKYYLQPPRILKFLRIKQHDQRVSPICFVSASDGVCERRENNITHTPHALPPDSTKQARNVYDAALSEELISFGNLVVTDNERLNKENEQSDEMIHARVKKMLARMLEDFILSGERAGTGIMSKAKMFLMSHRSIKWLAYLAVAFCVIFTVIYVISAVTGVPMPFPFAGGAYVPPGNSTATPTGP